MKSGPQLLVPPGPNTSKYLDPQIIYFNCVETFGAPEQKCLINLDPFEIFYYALNLHSAHFVKEDNLFHLKQLILQL